MKKKMFVGCIYIKNGKAQKSFTDQTIVEMDPIQLAGLYNDNDMDALLIFDLSDEKAEQNNALYTIDKICQMVNIPVYAGGGIQSVSDCEALLNIGCDKVILNLGKKEGYELLDDAFKAFGKEKITATIASEDSITMNREKLEMQVSTLILIDEHALKNCLGASVLDCIVFLPEISLDKMLSIMEKETVCGISGNIVNENAKNISALKSICVERKIAVCIFEAPMPFSEFKLLADGLLPVVVQDYVTDQVLMVAYMNEEAYLTTLRTGKMTYYSRSRRKLWMKGLTSGHFQYVKSLSVDCDNDTLLAKVKQVGAACHTGNYSCFYRELISCEKQADMQDESVLQTIFEQASANEIEKADLIRALSTNLTELCLLSAVDKTRQKKQKLTDLSGACIKALVELFAKNEVSLEDVYKNLS